VFDANPLATTRYALPAVAAAGVALALGASTATGRSWIARAILATALGWSVLQGLRLEQPSVPEVWALALAGLGGAVLGAAAPTRFSLSAKLAGPVAVGFALLVGASLEIPAGGLIRRQAAILPTLPGTPAVAWAQSQPGYRAPQRIYFAGTMIGQFAGERLEHQLVLLPPSTPCAQVRARAASNLVVAADEPVFRRLGVRTPADCLNGLPAAYEDGGVRVFGRLDAPASRRPR
jgi:hypothetical protein